jgi:hypothetical protein
VFSFFAAHAIAETLSALGSFPVLFVPIICPIFQPSPFLKIVWLRPDHEPVTLSVLNKHTILEISNPEKNAKDLSTGNHPEND